jgi:hypothetical protein
MLALTPASWDSLPREVENLQVEISCLTCLSQSDSDLDAEPAEDPKAPAHVSATYGLPAEALLLQEFAVKMARNGVLTCFLSSRVAYNDNISISEAPESLSSSQLEDINTFWFIINHWLSVCTYHAMQQQFCRKGSFSDLPSLIQLRTHMSKLSGIQPVKYDCCKNSCMCFAGPFANLDECLECNAP